MGIKQDFSSSILLCSEENHSVLFMEDGEEEEGEGIETAQMGLIGEEQIDGNLICFNFVGSFPMQTDECVELLIERESQYVPNQRYVKRLKNGSFEACFRRDAIDWITKVHSHFNFGPQTFYLAVSYFDRFLSAYELPKGEMWMQQLLSVACLSLAVKMEESVLTYPRDLQICEAEYVFEAKNIQRMELLVLSTLNWRLQAVTPFSFLDYFLRKFHRTPSYLVISQCVDLVLATIKDSEFIQFRPSEIAAAVALSLSSITDVEDINKLLISSIHPEKVMRCYKMIEDANPFNQSMPQSPVGVLDAVTGMYNTTNHDSLKRTKTTTVVISFEGSSPAAKRRKL